VSTPVKRSVILFQLLVFLMALGLVSPTANAGDHVKAAPRTLRSASELDYPPFALTGPDGGAAGFSVDLLRAVTMVVGLRVHFDVGPWQEIKEKLAEGQLDVLPLVSHSTERESMFAFTAPYLRMHGTIFVRKGEKSIRGKADLKDKEVMVMRGDTAHEYADKENLTSKLVLTNTFEEAMRRLSAGKHDAVIIQQLVGLQLIKKLGITNLINVSAIDEKSLKPVDKPLTGFEQKFCIAVRHGDSELLALLNEGLAIAIANGTYDALYNKWFSPILPEPPVPFSLVMRYLLLTLGPILFLLAIAGLWYLKREVKRKTLSLQQEIVERRQAEESLRESEAIFSAFLEHSPVYVFFKDRNIRSIRLSRNYEQMLGMPLNQMIGKTMDELFPSDLSKRMIADDLRVLNEGRAVDVVEAFGGRIYETTKFPVLMDGKPFVMAGFTVDITERKRMEDALRESEKNFRIIVENVNDAIYIYDLNGNILDVNENACRMLGYGRDQLVGASLAMIENPENARSFPERLERMLSVGAIVFDGEHVRSDGTIVPVEVSAKVVAREGNGVVHSFVRNIRERRQAEEEKEKLQSQLSQAQKMESVGRLAGGVAHDFNNKLGIIIGNVEMAMMDADPDGPIRQELEEVMKAAQQSAVLVRQLLGFARKQTVSPKVLNLNETVSGMLTMLRRLIGENIDLAWLPGHDLGRVKVDPSQVDQVLANLTVNARDAIPGVGKITIETKNATLDEDYCAIHVGSVPGQYVLLAVSDDGVGMSKETLEHLFEPFFTTKALGKGTGLGLSTVYGIVKQNAGFISVYSEPGNGTSFKIYLPRFEAEGVAGKEGGKSLAPPEGSETVLLVEDEQSILKVGTRMLERLGYRVLAAGKPSEAIALAEAHAGAIHLVLTDVVMPEMNGKALIELLESKYPELKILYMSGYSEDVIAHHGVLDRGVKMIQKPFSLWDLANKVRDALDKE
jgi:two-component system cell cycle sensor histidine kinase/response regulator CckA